MTRARYALLLVSVVLFTLALGIALGGGPLRTQVSPGIESAGEVHDRRDASVALTRRNVALAQEARIERGFADAVSSRLLAEKLAGRGVAILALPGVPARVAASVAEDVAVAGGSVTTSLTVGERLVDPTARALVDELTRRLVPEFEDLPVSAGTPIYQRAGAILSRALLTAEDGAVPMDDSARSVVSSFTTARLLDGAEPEHRASLVVVLVPEAGHHSAVMTAARDTIITELVTAMDQGSDGVVVAGPPASADHGGSVAAVRTAPEAAAAVSSVDSLTARAGEVVTLLALSEQAGGTTGHYGMATGADAIMPAPPNGGAG